MDTPQDLAGLPQRLKGLFAKMRFSGTRYL